MSLALYYVNMPMKHTTMSTTSYMCVRSRFYHSYQLQPNVVQGSTNGTSRLCHPVLPPHPIFKLKCSQVRKVKVIFHRIQIIAFANAMSILIYLYFSRFYLYLEKKRSIYPPNAGVIYINNFILVIHKSNFGCFLRLHL